MVLVQVAWLSLDQTTNSPVVFLRESVGDRGVAIWIGAAEASAISLMLQGDKSSRPMTHDLATRMITELGGVVSVVEIIGMENGTYLAEVTLTRPDGSTTVLDSRPSDGIAFALRFGAPIRASEALLRTEGATPWAPIEPLSDAALRAHLSRLRPEDFGRLNP